MLTFESAPARPTGFASSDELDAYAEWLSWSLVNLRHDEELPEEYVRRFARRVEVDDTALDVRRVSVDTFRRECHLYSPWTDPQRRVKLVWSGMDVPDDAGAAAYYAWVLGKPYPYKERKRQEISTTGRKRLKVSAEAAETGDMQGNGRMDDDILMMGGVDGLAGENKQTRRDQAEAQVGTSWLREYGADTVGALKRALGHAGMRLDDVIPAFASKGRPTASAKKVRDRALDVLCVLCPEVVPITDVAELFGMHRVKLSAALSTAREAAKGYDPAS